METVTRRAPVADPADAAGQLCDLLDGFFNQHPHYWKPGTTETALLVILGRDALPLVRSIP